jgi:hypothetical protein
MNNIALLEVMKILVFVGSIVFSTAYLLPRGIIFFLRWKNTQKHIDLSISITSFVVGIFMLIYFTIFFVLDLLKKMS